MLSILVIDSYDSFTYNLVGALEELGATCDVVLSDRLSLEQALAHPAAGILLSPGPCAPRDAGVCLEVARNADRARPILGVCLGHQVIGEAFGGRIVRAPEAVHGKTSSIDHDSQGVFAELQRPFEAMRYHSLVVDEQSLPETLVVTARSNGLIMGMRHRELPLEGVQFHPESFLTNVGQTLLATWLDIVSNHRDRIASSVV